MKLSWWLLIGFLALSGCATTFHGSPKIEGGPVGCKTQCSGWGMEMVGMVAMGEYSDSCICQVPSTAPKSTSSSVSASGAAVAGVWSEMQEAERQRVRLQTTVH